MDDVLTANKNLMLERLDDAIAKYGSQAALAKELNVSDSYVSAVKRLKKWPNKKLLDLLGLRLHKSVMHAYHKKETPKSMN